MDNFGGSLFYNVVEVGYFKVFVLFRIKIYFKVYEYDNLCFNKFYVSWSIESYCLIVFDVCVCCFLNFLEVCNNFL